MLIERVEALGALAVRLQDWGVLRPLILQRTDNYAMQRYQGWIRHGLTAAANANLFQRQEGDRSVNVSLIALARTQADRLDPLRPDADAGAESIVSSICQFDFLAVLAQMDAASSTNTTNWYPSFATFFATRVEPMALRLVRGEPPRQAIFSGSDRELAIALRTINEASTREALSLRYTGWMGFENEEIIRFIAENIPDDDVPY